VVNGEDIPQPQRLALYTAMYPGARPFLEAWYRSVRAQTDAGFDLWITTDQIDVSEVVEVLGEAPAATWLAAPAGASPAQVRQLAIDEMTQAYPAVVFTDCDDVLHPSRVASARAALAEHDVAACALWFMDADGRGLGPVFAPADPMAWDALLPRCNAFGLSNTAYRSSVLRDCSPLPPAAPLADWLLATRAWASGASLWFDPMPRMGYRQHGANIARVLGPFTPGQVRTATEYVLGHYELVLQGGWKLPCTHAEAIRQAQERTTQFAETIVCSPVRLREYVAALNRLTPQYVWWWYVAHPELEAMWTN
jgi:hypothetical protein